MRRHLEENALCWVKIVSNAVHYQLHIIFTDQRTAKSTVSQHQESSFSPLRFLLTLFMGHVSARTGPTCFIGESFWAVRCWALAAPPRPMFSTQEHLSADAVPSWSLGSVRRTPSPPVMASSLGRRTGNPGGAHMKVLLHACYQPLGFLSAFLTPFYLKPVEGLPMQRRSQPATYHYSSWTESCTCTCHTLSLSGLLHLGK